MGIVIAIKRIGPLLSRLGMNAFRLGGIMSRGIGGAICRILMGLMRVGGLFVRILSPLGKIVGAFLAGWYIGKLINKFKIVQNSVQWFFLKMIEGWNATVKFAGKAWDTIIKEVKFLAGRIKNIFTDIFTGAFGLILKGFTKISDLFGKKSAEASAITSKQKKFWNQFSKEHPIPYQQMIERNKRVPRPI